MKHLGNKILKLFGTMDIISSCFLTNRKVDDCCLSEQKGETECYNRVLCMILLPEHKKVGPPEGEDGSVNLFQPELAQLTTLTMLLEMFSTIIITILEFLKEICLRAE